MINIIIDFLFFLDIILGFRVTYRDAHTNQEITDSKKIAINYIFGMFWIDLFSTIPFDSIVEFYLKENDQDDSKSNLEVMSMLKLARVLRI